MPSVIINKPVSIFNKSIVHSIPESIRNKYGSGLSFPAVCFGANWGVSVGEDKIKAAMFVVLATPIGTRFMQPDFGSMVPYLVFEPYGPVLKRDLDFYTKEALIRWEPRILVKNVTIDDSLLNNNEISMNINYSIKGINSLNQFSIPISLQSGFRFTPNSNFTLSGKKVL